MEVMSTDIEDMFRYLRYEHFVEYHLLRKSRVV